MHNLCLIAFTLLYTLPAMSEEKAAELDTLQTAEKVIAFSEAKEKEIAQGDEVLSNFKLLQKAKSKVTEAPIVAAPPTMMEQEPSELSDTFCQSLYHNINIGIRHIEARGIGYTNGYTTLEGFGIYNHHDPFMPFLDLRGHIFDNGKLAGNAGIGARSYLSSIHHLLGYYFYYDIRQGGHGLTAQQLSPGIELLGRRMEYRINAHFPIGNQKSHRYDYAFDSFKGNNILLKYKRQYVMKGADAEVGVHIAQSSNYDLYAGAGPYYFHAAYDTTWGGKARLNGKYKEYITVEASYSYDHLFGSIFQGSVAINIPFGKKIRKKERACPQGDDYLLSRESQSPYRFEIPVIKKHKSSTKAINPNTNDPWIVWFVDNTSSSLGTFNSPFPTLTQAQNASSPNEIIYVFPGDGTTTGLDQGIALKDQQKLFGASTVQSILTTQGTIQIPQFSNTLPLLTAPNTVIALANNNEVSGFRITTTSMSTPNLIFGSNISGGSIHDNVIFANVQNLGIKIQGTGNYNIENNQLFAPLSSSDGISLAPNAGGLSAIVKNNTIIGYSNCILLNADVVGGSGGHFIVEDNTLSDAGNRGIFFQSFNVSSGSILTIENNTLNSMGENSIYVATNESLCLTINNNQITASGQNALYVENDANNTFALISNNKITDVGASFYGVECLTFDPFCLVLRNNVVTNGSGFLLEVGNSANMSVNSRGNEGTLTTTIQISGGTITLDPSATCSCPQ